MDAEEQDDLEPNNAKVSKGDEHLLRLLGRKAPRMPVVQEPEPLPKQSQSSKPQPTEPRNLLQEMSDRLTQEDLASGLTVTEREPESDTERLTVSFVPRRATKPTEPPAE
jgi:hypothetical protein